MQAFLPASLASSKNIAEQAGMRVTRVATAILAQLLMLGVSDPEVGKKASIIQAAIFGGMFPSPREDA
jgi:hypothetical protein